MWVLAAGFFGGLFDDKLTTPEGGVLVVALGGIIKFVQSKSDAKTAAKLEAIERRREADLARAVELRRAELHDSIGTPEIGTGTDGTVTSMLGASLRNQEQMQRDIIQMALQNAKDHSAVRDELRNLGGSVKEIKTSHKDIIDRLGRLETTKKADPNE